MEPASWILLSLLALSGGSNWLQFQKIHNLAEDVKEKSTELQQQKADMKEKDAQLMKAEVEAKGRRKRYQDELACAGFVIHSHARQLHNKHKDQPHAIHAKTTKGFSATMGKPPYAPDDKMVWNLKYITDRESKLALAKLQKEQLEKQVEQLRAQLRSLQTTHYTTLDELDVKSTELVSVTSEKAGILSQFNDWIKYAIYIAIIWGIITVYGYAKGFYNKHVKSKYENAIKKFGVSNDDGNSTAAAILKENGLPIPSILQKHLS